ncbi:MAG: hypothetical protein R3A48_24850 [Polyangiales bacterium]
MSAASAPRAACSRAAGSAAVATVSTNEKGAERASSPSKEINASSPAPSASTASAWPSRAEGCSDDARV